ncbi:MAG: hypothetical protein D6738_07820 [Acidobacteria bacterium]|nr:MAG: hypothetical protein D6738_07820 [Acidobacteriota bacterium]
MIARHHWKRGAAPLAALALLVAAHGCGRDDGRESLISRIPADAPVVVIEGEHVIPGAWLRNMAVTQEILVRQSMPGMPLSVDEYSLIENTRKLLTKINLLALEARRRGLTVTPQEISDRLSQEVARFESTEQWRRQLEASGLTVEERRREIEIELLFDKYREEIVRPRVLEQYANDDKAREFYEKNPTLWDEPLRVHLFHILRSVARDAPESERERERRRIEQARERILAGEPFEDVARSESTENSNLRGGEIGWIAENTRELLPEVRDVVFRLEPGKVSDVVESPMGFHLFLVKERRERRHRPFEEVKDDIKERIAAEAIKIELEKEIAALQQQMDIRYLRLEPYIGEKPERAAGGQAPAGLGGAGASEQPAAE